MRREDLWRLLGGLGIALVLAGAMLFADAASPICECCGCQALVDPTWLERLMCWLAGCW